MPARFKVRRGNTPPPVETATQQGLIDYELGYDTASNQLYINNAGTVMTLDSADSDTVGGIDPSSFVRNDDGDQYIDGNLTLNGELIAIAQKARYADIAEYYETDKTYSAGDVVMVGVESEATLADGSSPIMGVCSTNPAYLMNIDIEAEHFAPVALKGRVPVKITGSAERGDYIVVDVDNIGKGKAVKSLDGIDRERLYIGVCITAGEDVCEVKI